MIQGQYNQLHGCFQSIKVVNHQSIYMESKITSQTSQVLGWDHSAQLLIYRSNPNNVIT